MKWTSLAASIAFALTACTSVTPYQPAGDGYGFTDQMIESNRYRVAFKGNTATPRVTVENHLLYRMAEITLDNGFDYFRVLEHDTECHTNYLSSGSAPCATYRPHKSRFPYATYGYDCDRNAHMFETREYESVAYITLHKGQKPNDDANAFDASAVKRNLANEIEIEDR